MGLFSRLFGSSQSNTKEEPELDPIEYKGFHIYQKAMPENGQFRIAGRITKDIDGETKTHRFIRSDVLPSEDDANELMLKKAQMFIDQMGNSIFS